VASVPAATLSHVEPQVAHSIPGRVRLRFAPDDCTYAHLLSRGLQAHPSVINARWNSPGRSLTVHFNPSLEYTDLLTTLPDVSSCNEPRQVADRQIDWAKIGFACLLSLIPLGPLGSVALTFVTSLVEQTAVAPSAQLLPAADLHRSHGYR
jgi:hypothetical protein